jgi:hypothetical protein
MQSRAASAAGSGSGRRALIATTLADRPRRCEAIRSKGVGLFENLGEVRQVDTNRRTGGEVGGRRSAHRGAGDRRRRLDDGRGHQRRAFEPAVPKKPEEPL